jgi:hypothetical protein
MRNFLYFCAFHVASFHPPPAGPFLPLYVYNGLAELMNINARGNNPRLNVRGGQVWDEMMRIVSPSASCWLSVPIFYRHTYLMDLQSWWTSTREEITRGSTLGDQVWDDAELRRVSRSASCWLSVDTLCSDPRRCTNCICRGTNSTWSKESNTIEWETFFQCGHLVFGPEAVYELHL